MVTWREGGRAILAHARRAAKEVERENREQFEGFYRLLYELKTGELRDTQLVLVDKEFSAPAAELGLKLIERHMRPGDPENPPLIPYYDGK